MPLKKKDEFDIDQFWRDYEATIGEKVLARSLARYISGWPEYPQPLWGLAIATSGGFRFHHFPHEGGFAALFRMGGIGEAPREKTFFIPRTALRSAELVLEKHWLKKILLPSSPLLIIRCCINETETEVVIETDRSAIAVVDALKGGS